MKKEIKSLLLVFIALIAALIIFDISSISSQEVKSRLYPEPPPAEIKTELIITPQIVKEGGALYFEVIPGSLGSGRAITIYKFKPVKHIRMDVHRFCRYEGTTCGIQPSYKFTYILPSNEKWSTGFYYAIVGGASGRAFVPFIIIPNREYQ